MEKPNINLALSLTEEELIHIIDVLENNFAMINPHGVDYRNSVFDRLQGKIFSSVMRQFNVHDTWNKIRKNRYEKENCFADKPIFMGAGMYSNYDCSLLHKRLRYALNVLGGKQQNGGQGTEFNEQSDKEDESLIKETLRDIIAAFGYKPLEIQNV